MTGIYQVSGPEEQAWLDKYHENVKDYPSVGLTADLVVTTIHNGRFSILLVLRGDYPYKGCWALPGGFIHADEPSEVGARRELQEETNINLSTVYLEQLKTYSEPGRDPRMRVVSVAYFALLPDLPKPVGGDDAVEARWWAVEDLDLTGGIASENSPAIAFDHAQIISDGLERIRSKFEYTPLAKQFLEEIFTLADLRRIYETVWGKTLHAANFRRKVLSTPGFVIPVGTTGPSTLGGRSAALYYAGDATLLHPAMLRARVDEDQYVPDDES